MSSLTQTSNNKQQTLYILGSEKHIFNYKVDSEKTDKSYSSHIDYIDMMTDSFILQPKFKFYQTHEFHKLFNNLSENKAFSIFHTNICSLLEDPLFSEFPCIP